MAKLSQPHSKEDPPPPPVLVFGTRQTQLLILALPQGSRTSISEKGCTTRMQDVNSREDCAGTEGHMSLLLSAQFSCKPKPVLIKVY